MLILTSLISCNIAYIIKNDKQICLIQIVDNYSCEVIYQKYYELNIATETFLKEHYKNYFVLLSFLNKYLLKYKEGLPSNFELSIYYCETVVIISKKNNKKYSKNNKQVQTSTHKFLIPSYFNLNWDVTRSTKQERDNLYNKFNEMLKSKTFIIKTSLPTYIDQYMRTFQANFISNIEHEDIYVRFYDINQKK